MVVVISRYGFHGCVVRISTLWVFCRVFPPRPGVSVIVLT